MKSSEVDISLKGKLHETLENLKQF